MASNELYGHSVVTLCISNSQQEVLYYNYSVSVMIIARS